MKKILNIASVQNELTGSSAFFRRPSGDNNQKVKPTKRDVSEHTATKPRRVSQVGSRTTTRQPKPTRTEVSVKPSVVTKQSSPLPKRARRPAKTRNTERKTVRKSDRSKFRTEKRSVKLPFPAKRHTKRYSFEFFTDQLTTLKWLEGQAMMNGEGFNKSDFMRTALDNHFEQLGVKLVKPKE